MCKSGFLTLFLFLFSPAPNSISKGVDQQTIVIVHGAFSGGWDWKVVGKLLSDRGFTVYRPTLTGLGERSHLASPEINLSTHIKDVVNVLRYEGLSNVVLCGHSYGGMVLTGVINEVPELIKRAVFLDAVVPDDGESFVSFHEAMGFEVKDKPDNVISQ